MSPEPPSVAAALLFVVHSSIGLREQLFSVGCIVGEERSTDACRKGFDYAEPAALSAAVSFTRRQVSRAAFGGQPWSHQDEFVASHSREEVVFPAHQP